LTRWNIGIDTGGTFTDLVAVDPDSGDTRVAKVPSTTADPSEALVNSLKTLFAREPDIKAEDIDMLIHGTTVATNAVLEGKGVKTGLLITKGTRAVYEGRRTRQLPVREALDMYYQRPKMLVPQRHTEEINERMSFEGKVLDPLDEDSAIKSIERLKGQGIQSIAVCFIFSFTNADHESRIKKLIEKVFPEARISLSHEVLPVIREYQRLSTTVLDAYVGPIIENYAQRLNDRLASENIERNRVFFMQSNGGIMHISMAAEYPVQTLLSGPAGGVIAAARFGQDTGFPSVLSFDMGGTSTDIAAISKGEVTETREGLVAAQDCGVPMTEIRTIGAGGGTIAYIDGGGLLQVGPESAGAVPGPACYGRGGENPTVTDADLTLGYLSAEAFLGGNFSIDPALARESINEKIAKPLGMNVPQAADGIVKVINSKMESEVRLALMERGFDPRAFSLVAFGGAGPVHASKVAKDLGIPKVIIPPYPGLGSAMGLLMTDVKHQYMQSRLGLFNEIPTDVIEGMFEQLENRAKDDLARENFSPSDYVINRQVDLRYIGQGYELTIDCPLQPLDQATRDAVRKDFDDLHEQVYGHAARSEPTELVNVRLAGTVAMPTLSIKEIADGPQTSPTKTREAYFEEIGKYTDVPVFERNSLNPGHQIQGPAIIEQADSTTVVCPGQSAEVDKYGYIIITTVTGGTD
jgi:N-methylhydantoinase A